MLNDSISIVAIIKSIVALIPFITLCFLSKKINLKRTIRSRQFLMPVIALIYIVIMTVVMKRYSELLLRIIERLPILIKNLLNMPWIPSNIQNILTAAAHPISVRYHSFNFRYWIFYIANTSIILMYYALKGVCLGIMKVRFKDNAIHNNISGFFYSYFPERDIWCIKVEFVKMRQMFQSIYYTVVILASLIMVVSDRMYDMGLLKSMFCPVVGVLVIGEMFFYLDGLTKKEFTEDILGEEEEAYKVVNYSLLRKYLRSLFGDKLLSENTDVNNALEYTITNEELLERLANSADQKVVNFSIYYNNLNKQGFELDHNYLSSSLDLLNGKSILFNNPFYRDLIPYAFYPMNRILLSGSKVLVVLGRHAIEDSVTQWLKDGIEAVTNIPFLWRIGLLEEDNEDYDIGIITRSKVIDPQVHNNNSEFLKNVGFVVIIEPSRLISTAQIGLNLLAKKCRGKGEKNIVFCMCDRNCDGLVDAMSHIVMTNLTEVSATNKHLGTSSYMCWEADNQYLHHRIVPNISRYLGLGTELSFAALKNQVSNVYWYGGEMFPVHDIRWIDKQYYYDLMKYAALPTAQEAMNDYFHVSSDMWSAEVQKNSYISVEDESFNMFEMLRNFATRSTDQGFINIISSDYLLKDYMASNSSIFETDAKAIPYLVADYARTRRNIILRILSLMSVSKVNKGTVISEFSLIGLPIMDIRKQLWYEMYRCYSTLESISALPEDYGEAVKTVAELGLISDDASHIFHIDIINEEERYNYDIGKMETVYYINNLFFNNQFINDLKSSSYVAEDEKGYRYFLGAELCGQIYQRHLPGQFFTFNGKYYEMLYITSDNQVLVRRAADHINGRPVYRQLREYTISAIEPSKQIGADLKIDGIRVVREYADIKVTTTGYYRMERYHDFKNGKKILFENGVNRIPQRTYKNKSVLRIELPNIENAFTPDVRYTITVLINEVFRTLFAENQAFVIAATDTSHISEDMECQPLTYSLRGNGADLQKNSIYIIEDSQLDIGLLVAVERNIKRILEIVTDYLSWNQHEIAISLRPSLAKKYVITKPVQETPDQVMKEGVFKRIKRKIKNSFGKLFGRKKKKETEGNPDPVIDSQMVKDKGDVTDSDNTDAITSGTDEAYPVDNMPAPGDGADQPLSEVPKSPYDFTRLPYHKRYYMLYGYSSVPDTLDINSTLGYLSALGFGNNSLKAARNSRRIAQFVSATFKPNKKNARYCDFCGNEIFGVEFETLSDGRDRCMSCTRTAVKTEKEFRRIYEDVKRNLESFFGIKINTGIRIEMVSSQKLHRKLKKAFIPTPYQDGRVLGVAVKDRNGYTLMVENGAPRIQCMLTLAHELTHIWQYLNWDDRHIVKTYGKKLRLEIYEGMAKWVEIQYAYLINEPSVAKREEIITVQRGDEYGNGYIRYKANYPITTGNVITRETPFMNLEMPLDLTYCSDVSVMLDPNNGARGYDDDDWNLDVDDIESILETDDVDKLSLIPTVTDTYLRSPKEVTLYAYEKLNDIEKDAYNILFNAISEFKSTITEFSESVSVDVLLKAKNYILKDHPEIFWYNGTINYTYDSNSGAVKTCELTYCLTREQAEKRTAEIDEALTDFISGIQNDMSDYEVALAIYENIINLVDYDSLELERESNKGDDNVPDDLRSIYGVFCNKKAVCAGYAKATQYLFNRLGFECTYISGRGLNDRHAWNLVKLSGEYYYIDVTWDDHSNTKALENSSPEITYDYFCVTTSDILRDHTFDDSLPLPECTATECNYYYRNGLLLDEYSFNKVCAIIKENVISDKCRISLKTKDKDVYEKMYQSLISNNRLNDVVQYLCLDSASRVSTRYQYSYSSEKLKLTIILSKT